MEVPFKYSEALGGHVPVLNEAMETPVDGLYVAGNITGIESSKVARDQGTVAGLSIVHNKVKSVESRQALYMAMGEVKATREAASIQFHPDITLGREAIQQAFREINA